MAEWNKTMLKLKLNRSNKKNDDFIRRFTAGVIKMIEIDATGRLFDSKDLVIFAQIDRY